MRQKVFFICIAAVAALAIAALTFTLMLSAENKPDNSISNDGDLMSTNNNTVENMSSELESGKSASSSSSSESPSESQTVVTELTAEGEMQKLTENNITHVLSNPIENSSEQMAEFFAAAVPPQYQSADNIAETMIENNSTDLLFCSCDYRDVKVIECDHVANVNGFMRYNMKISAFAYNISPQESGMIIPDQNVILDTEVVVDKEGKIVFLHVTQNGRYQVL